MNKPNGTQITQLRWIFTDLFRYFTRDILSVFIRCICVISVLLHSSYAQNPEIDSLLNLFKTYKVPCPKPCFRDTQKVKILNELSFALHLINPDSTILLATQAAALAKKLTLNAGKGSDLWKTIKKGEADAYGNVGVGYRVQGDYPNALEYYLRALKIDEELGNKNGIAKRLGNIGIIYYEQGDYPKALEYYLRALKIDEELGNKNGIAKRLGNIGIVYYEQGDYPKALDYYLRALKIDEETGNKNGIARHLGNIGNIYGEQSDYPKALEYYLRALKTDEELGNKNGIARHLGNIGNVYNDQGDYPKALEYYLRALKIDEETGNKKGIAMHLGNIGSLYTSTKKYAEAEKYLLDALKIDKEIGAMNAERHFEQMLSELYEKTGRYTLALEHYKKAMVLQDTLFNEEKDKELIRKEMNYQFEKKEAAAKAEHDKFMAVAAEESKRQQVMLWFAAGILILVSIFSVWIFRERKKSDKLLRNILPEETAIELKAKGRAQPKSYEMVTVMFTDFKGFTMLAEKMSAEELVAELDFVFKKFDEIISRYPIEKIKTIGDAYMCAGGLPVANTTNPMDIVLAAIEIKKFMLSYKEKRISEGKPFFEIRIGVHTGAIVAGVVGDKKFAYDIWGDTVNTASRMESSGVPGHVNISGETYKLLRSAEHYSALQFTFRGKIPAKNKGEIEMYFVERNNFIP